MSNKMTLEEIAIMQIELNEKQILEAAERHVRRIESQLSSIKNYIEDYRNADSASKLGVASCLNSALTRLGTDWGISDCINELNGNMKFLQGIQYATRQLTKAD